MTFPVYIPLGSLKIHPHFVFETAAYVMAFRVYLLLRKSQGDALDDGNRWWVIAAAAMGAPLRGTASRPTLAGISNALASS